MAIANLAVPRPGESPNDLYRRMSRKASDEELELTLWHELSHMWRDIGWPEPHPQVLFDTSGRRRWRFDFAYFLPYKLAIEVDGGVWAGGRHVRGTGYTRDCEKLNAAAIAGWRVLRFTGDMVRDGRALDTIRLALHLPEMASAS